MSSLDLTGSLGRRKRTGRIVVVVLILAAGLAAGAWFVLNQPDPPDGAADAFAAAWTDGDPASGPVADPATVETRYAEVVEGLDGSPVEVTVRSVTPDPEVDGRAEVELEVAWTLPGDRLWSYPTTAPMTLAEEGWEVEVTERVLHPELPTGGRLDARRTTPPRADVLGPTGEPLVTTRETVDVGIQPSRIDDVDDTVAAVRDALDLDLDDLAASIEAADPDHFVPVVVLRRDDYDAVADELQPIPGTVFRDSEQVLAPTSAFARATLGRAGPVTAEMLEAEPDRYEAGDIAGTSGLQAAYDEQLAGRPGLEVRALPPEGAEVPDGEDPPGPITLFTADPEPGEPLQVSFDVEVQNAADEALAEITEFPSALVAVRVSDGHVVAAANGPASGGLDLAMTGRYAPGSTFKVVTTAALLEEGLSPGDEVACPPEQQVDGFAFSNAEDSSLGDVPFSTAFAQSCNTAFVTLGGELAPDALQRSASAFGMGEEVDLGVDAFTGDVPVTESATEQAAASIGQGRVLASPFAMAQVAATAVRGAYLPPTLVLGDEAPTPEPTALADEVAEALPDLLREVVTDGSGSAVDDVPGDPVLGKTGTAEYGDESPPRTHAWFLGAQGDLAFAVIVAETEDSFGGQVAAPVAADFLERLAD